MSLTELYEVLSLFKSQVGDWVAAFEASSWKLQAYPKMKMFSKPVVPSSQMSSETTNDFPAPIRDTTSILSDEEAVTLRDLEAALDFFEHYSFKELQDLNSRDLQRLSVKRKVFEIALVRLELSDLAILNYYTVLDLIQILLAHKLTPTDWVFQKVLTSGNEEVIGLISSALISDYSKRAEYVVNGSLASAIMDEDLKDLVGLLTQDPSLANSSMIENGSLPLASAVLYQKSRSMRILLLLGASPVLSLAGDKSPVVIAVEKSDLDLALFLLRSSRSSLGTGWEWDVS